MKLHLESPAEDDTSDTAVDLKTPSCHNCRHACTEKDKFCTNCGSPLFESCLNCNEPVRIGRAFCGICGTKTTDVLAEQKRHIEDTFQKVKELSIQGEYTEAIDLLKPLKDVKDTAVRDRVVETIRNLARDYQKGTARAEEVLVRAEAYIENRQHQQACALIETLPVGLHSEAIEQLHKVASDTLAEIDELESCIKQVNKGSLSPAAVQDLQKLLTLAPNHSRAREEAVRLSKRLSAAAKKFMQQGRYSEALRFLTFVPEAVLTSEIEEFRSHLTEIVRLMDDLANAPHVDEILPLLAARLAGLIPEDQRVAQLAAKAKQRREKFQGDTSLDMPVWKPAPKQPALGCPIDLLCGPRRLKIENKTVLERMCAHPGCFAVASGLALQGLGKSSIAVDLLPDKSGKLLRRWTGHSRARKVRAAWGIDLGPSSLKAVRLELDDKNDHVVIDRCELLEHAKPLAMTVDAAEQLHCVRETMERFFQGNELVFERGNERVCAGLLSRHVLYRNVKIPPLKPSQMAGAMALEARQQFPLAPEELNWRYQYIQSGQDSKSIAEGPILLVAAKTVTVQQRLDLLKEVGVEPDILQSDSLALHNYFSFENESTGTPDVSQVGDSGKIPAVALVDVGSNATNLVVSSADSIWINSTSIGGDRFTKALVGQLNLTNSQAEQVKRNPTKAAKLHTVYEALDPLFEELAADIERSLVLFTNSHPNNKVVRIVGCGGGFLTHGLLARLRAEHSEKN
ncbi:MAG: pilus assembly protein PilM [Pirellulales bacterium]|nr:pilus assembly protein PilM [Pirellulales bacterium]